MARAEREKSVSLISAVSVVVRFCQGRGLNTSWAAIRPHNKVSLDPESSGMTHLRSTGVSSTLRKDKKIIMLPSGPARDNLVVTSISSPY